ncbi:MAG: RNA 2',3'-cyclic phosphodiesterase [candidate division Zixibacteria bacterium]|nr:RNA 2',3'-cyclic phosphodiesterase [candidate division Zixibacteria bacterium]
MYRLFVAIDPPESVRRRLGELQTGIPGATWKEESEFHLTVRFIGEVDGASFSDILSSLKIVRMEPFEVEISGIGQFPLRGDPRSLWAGIKSGEALRTLRNRIERTLRDVGISTERRKFHPHITLARLRNTPIERVAYFLQGSALFQAPPFLASEFHLYSSQKTSSGAIHTLESSYSLK